MGVTRLTPGHLTSLNIKKTVLQSRNYCMYSVICKKKKRIHHYTYYKLVKFMTLSKRQLQEMFYSLQKLFFSRVIWNKNNLKCLTLAGSLCSLKVPSTLKLTECLSGSFIEKFNVSWHKTVVELSKSGKHTCLCSCPLRTVTEEQVMSVSMIQIQEKMMFVYTSFCFHVQFETGSTKNICTIQRNFSRLQMMSSMLR